jgi:hypothetical protein
MNLLFPDLFRNTCPLDAKDIVRASILDRNEKSQSALFLKLVHTSRALLARSDCPETSVPIAATTGEVVRPTERPLARLRLVRSGPAGAIELTTDN